MTLLVPSSIGLWGFLNYNIAIFVNLELFV